MRRRAHTRETGFNLQCLFIIVLLSWGSPIASCAATDDHGQDGEGLQPDDPRASEVEFHENVEPDPDPESDPYCHWDCFPYDECLGDTLVQHSGTPVPCEYWTGECPTEPSWTVACARGCVDDPCVGPVCEEDRPRYAGLPCQTDDDCQPPYSQDLRLECGPEAVCVPDNEPSFDIGQPCGIEQNDFSYGLQPAEACHFGYCVITVRVCSSSCLGAPFCTKPCQFDWECPPTWGCWGVPGFAPERFDFDKVCWPSPPAPAVSPTCGQ